MKIDLLSSLVVVASFSGLLGTPCGICCCSCSCESFESFESQTEFPDTDEDQPETRSFDIFSHMMQEMKNAFGDWLTNPHEASQKYKPNVVVKVGSNSGDSGSEGPANVGGLGSSAQQSSGQLAAAQQIEQESVQSAGQQTGSQSTQQLTQGPLTQTMQQTVQQSSQQHVQSPVQPAQQYVQLNPQITQQIQQYNQLPLQPPLKQPIQKPDAAQLPMQRPGQYPVQLPMQQQIVPGQPSQQFVPWNQQIVQQSVYQFMPQPIPLYTPQSLPQFPQQPVQQPIQFNTQVGLHPRQLQQQQQLAGKQPVPQFNQQPVQYSWPQQQQTVNTRPMQQSGLSSSVPVNQHNPVGNVAPAGAQRNPNSNKKKVKVSKKVIRETYWVPVGSAR